MEGDKNGKGKEGNGLVFEGKRENRIVNIVWAYT